ncbi:MAG: D-Ala-D-Ala carboxypeptidase family metallohydrolase [Rhizomicrobium sp.]
MDQPAKLSEHFTLEEGMTTEHRNVDNTPTPAAFRNMKISARGMELVRELLGFAIFVRSWFRCLSLNAMVGGSPTSDHPNGWAIDFVCPQFGTPLEICRAIVGSDIKFDQLIQEGAWVHISFAPRMRGEVLTKNAAGVLVRGLH